jgi:nitrite reductase (NO-forming)
MKKTLNATLAALILLSGLMVLPGIMNNRGYASLSSTIPANSPITTAEVFLSPSPMSSQLTPSLQQQSWQQQSNPMKPMDLNFVVGPGLTDVAEQTAQTMVKQGANIKQVTFVAYDEEVTLPQGNKVQALTFNGTVPSPTIRVTQGDILNVTIINYPKNKLIHSIDHHASIISAVPNFGPVNVGAKKSFEFVATQPGFFKYHCEGNGVLGMDQHVFSGMSGGVIVDPAKGYTGYTLPTYDDKGNQVNTTVSPEAKEITYVFSEWYLDKDGSYNQTAMNEHIPTYTSINGIPFGYDPVITKTKNAMPIHIKQGDHVRFFLLNIGDEMVNFHIVGEQLDRVTDGQVVSGWGKQTYLVGGSNDAIIDVMFTKPGVYAPVNHDYADLFKGQASLIVVDGPDGQPGTSLGLTDYKNPSNAVPPMGKNSIAVETKPYYLGAPIKWDGQNETVATPILANATTSSTTPSAAEPGTQTPVPPQQAPAVEPVPGSNTTSTGGGALAGNVTTPSGGEPVIPPAANAPGNSEGSNSTTDNSGGASSSIPGVTQ